MLPVIPSTAITAACHPNVKKLSMRLRLLPMDTPKTKSKAHTVACMPHLLIPLKEQRPRKRYPTPVPIINKIKIRNMIDRFLCSRTQQAVVPRCFQLLLYEYDENVDACFRCKKSGYRRQGYDRSNKPTEPMDVYRRRGAGTGSSR